MVLRYETFSFPGQTFCLSVMNESKMNNYLQRCSYLDRNLPERKFTPIILSDSKASYLFPESVSLLENGIVWLYEPGLSAENCIKWISSHLGDLDAQFGKFEMFILGTCDLGLKNRQGLILKPRVSSVACRLIRTFREFANDANDRGYSVTLLEIPGFCIREYIRAHGHKSPEILIHHDFGLQTAIQLINESIRVINRRNGKKSPNFNAAIGKTETTIVSPINTGGHLTSF